MCRIILYLVELFLIINIWRTELFYKICVVLCYDYYFCVTLSVFICIYFVQFLTYFPNLCTTRHYIKTKYVWYFIMVLLFVRLFITSTLRDRYSKRGSLIDTHLNDFNWSFHSYHISINKMCLAIWLIHNSIIIIK